MKPQPLILAGVLVLAAILGAGSAWLWRQWGLHQERVAALPTVRLTDLAGRTWSLADWRGKVVLLNFWASWCAPCIDELPRLVEAQARYGAQGLQVVGPAMDELEQIRPLLARFGINYPVAVEFGEVDAAMRAFGNDTGSLPFSVLIGRDGTVTRRVLGVLTAEELQRMIEAALAS